jgi:hypothetical protein
MLCRTLAMCERGLSSRGTGDGESMAGSGCEVYGWYFVVGEMGETGEVAAAAAELEDPASDDGAQVDEEDAAMGALEEPASSDGVQRGVDGRRKMGTGRRLTLFALLTLEAKSIS